MKLLLVSDLHYTLRHYDWVLERAPHYDAVVLAGDQLSVAAPVAIEAQIAAVRATVRKLATLTKVFMCSGNHDLNALNAAGEKTADWLDALDDAGVVSDGSSAVVGDTLITVLPWWDGPIARVDSEAHLDATDRAVAQRWIWVYHSPPTSMLSWTGSRHYGDPTVAEWITRWSPDAVLCGHIHQAPFAPDGSWVDRIDGTWVFNPGKQTGPVPTSVEIDLSAGAARWSSMTGVEERILLPT
ncbi:MAG: metallophosphoesterase family protein [Sporichthyaceae bacterium]